VRRFLLVTVLISLLPGVVWALKPDPNAVDKRIRSGGVGIRAGLSNESRYWVNGHSYELKTSLGLGVFFDVALSKRSAITITTDLYDVHLFGTRQWLMNIALGYKPTIYYSAAKKIAWRAAGTVGFANLAEIARMEPTNYLTLKLAAELLMFHNKNIGYVFELGVTGSPTGGNDDSDVTWGPVWTLRVGVMY